MLVIPPRAELHNRPVETERLILTPVDESDGHELWFAINGSRDTLKPWLPWVQYHTDPVASGRFAEACATDWDHGRAVRFVIRERASRTLLGIVGLEQCVHVHKSCDLGYWLRKEARGSGQMTEAAHACVEFGFRRMAAHRVRVAASTQNHPSLAVIARLGFRFEGIARQAEYCDGRWLDHAVFARLSSDT